MRRCTNQGDIDRPRTNDIRVDRELWVSGPAAGSSGFDDGVLAANVLNVSGSLGAWRVLEKADELLTDSRSRNRPRLEGRACADTTLEATPPRLRDAGSVGDGFLRKPGQFASVP